MGYFYWFIGNLTLLTDTIKDCFLASRLQIRETTPVLRDRMNQPGHPASIMHQHAS